MSPRVTEVLVCPGNGGTQTLPKTRNIALDRMDIPDVAHREGVDFVVVGPEQYLVDGIVDRCKKSGIPCFGPSSRAAEIEASKSFAKDFMKRHGIPTARYEIFTDYEAAVKHTREVTYPVVIKVILDENWWLSSRFRLLDWQQAKE